MLKDQIEDSVTFDDVLFLPGHSKLLHSEVSVKRKISQTLGCNIPLLSAQWIQLPNIRKLFAWLRRESHVHDIFFTEEAPNYQMNVKS